jgi:hypothetical protein
MKPHLALGLAVVLGMSSVGCIHEPVALHLMGGPLGTAPPPAPDPARVASCKTTKNWHNAWILAGTIFGGLSGAGGAADAISSDKGVQTGVGIGVISAGVLAAISSTAAGFTSDTYATDNCQQILQQAADASAATAR